MGVVRQEAARRGEDKRGVDQATSTRNSSHFLPQVSLFHRCVYLLIEGGHLDDVLSFLEALFRERQYGPHKNQRVDIARHILTSVPSFVGAVLSNAPRRNADYAVPVVCMLLLLVTDVQFRQDMAQDQRYLCVCRA